MLKEQCMRSEEEKRYCWAEVRCLTAQLMDAREQAERLKASQLKYSADMATERKCRREAEERGAKMQQKCQLHEQVALKLKSQKMQLAKENSSLERKLKQLRKGMDAKSVSRDFDSDRLAAHMADRECGPLRRCAVEEKGALRKKLLLKWHPDKQPSTDHAKFATHVVQEMQNCPAWQD